MYRYIDLSFVLISARKEISLIIWSNLPVSNIYKMILSCAKSFFCLLIDFILPIFPDA